MDGAKRIIFHIDANSAYLSWTAADRLNRGDTLDLRTAPAVIAGDPDDRHGIILAKSIPAKKFGIVTGESLSSARGKCRELLVYPPDYELYMDCSQAMYEILQEYSPVVQRYSIDECFLDFTESEKRFGGAEQTAEQIRERMREELGFTVNVGVGPNKLLAKMAGELRKPDAAETIWPWEIRDKLWPLPVRELFMVGRATEEKLRRVNIRTIGDLAQTDPGYLKAVFHSHGGLIHRYANGLDDEPVTANADIFQKGVGNSATMRYDLTEPEEISRALLALCERVGMRLRRLQYTASLVGISLKTDGFIRRSHRRELSCTTDSTTELYRCSEQLFFECWKGEPIRQAGVFVSHLSFAGQRQLSLFQQDWEREERVDQAVDCIRKKFGDGAVMRGSFANTGRAPLLGGVHEGRYIMMGGYEQ